MQAIVSDLGQENIISPKNTATSTTEWKYKMYCTCHYSFQPCKALISNKSRGKWTVQTFLYPTVHMCIKCMKILFRYSLNIILHSTPIMGARAFPFICSLYTTAVANKTEHPQLHHLMYFLSPWQKTCLIQMQAPLKNLKLYNDLEVYEKLTAHPPHSPILSGNQLRNMAT